MPPSQKATPPTVRAAPATPPTQKAPAKATPPERLLAGPDVWEGAVAKVQIINITVIEDSLLVAVSVTVDDPKNKVTFRAWRDARGQRGATVVDENGTKYNATERDETIDGLIIPRLRERLRGEMGYGSGPVYADHPRVDMLLFEKPTPAAKELGLDLDASHVGEEATIRFRIPREMWERKQ